MPKTYEPIATQTLSTTATSVTFSSISSAYTDLVVIVSGLVTTSAQNLNVTFNGDTSALYSRTAVYGTGTVAASTRDSNLNKIYGFYFGTSQCVGIAQIMNYSNTTTNKTVIFRTNSASEALSATIGLYRNTAAITSVTITADTSNLAVGSTFTLYGIKAA